MVGGAMFDPPVHASPGPSSGKTPPILGAGVRILTNFGAGVVRNGVGGAPRGVVETGG